jgi:hypothetical protein
MSAKVTKASAEECATVSSPHQVAEYHALYTYVVYSITYSTE